MSSEWKYRIKCASRPDRKSIYSFDSFDADTKDMWAQDKVWDDTDINIKPHTCAHIIKVRSTSGKVQYVCGIKNTSGNWHLEPGKQEDRFQISGAEKFDDSLDEKPDWLYDVFKCTHLNIDNGESVTIEAKTKGLDDVVTFPQCNCYAPRGGLAVGFLQGAVRESGSLGIAPTVSTDPNTPPHAMGDHGVYLEWYQNVHKSNQVTEYFMAGLNLDTPITQLYPATPPRLSYIFMVLNARATLVPCCYWTRHTPILYQPKMFRVIDKAHAKFTKKTAALAAAIKEGDIVATPDWWSKVTSAEKALGVIAQYDANSDKSKDDYFSGGNEDDDFQKNALLGLHYDFTLPNLGNNQRIVYVIDHDEAADYTGPLRNKENTGKNCTDECKKQDKYHFHSSAYFRPENCGHPNVDTRYTWGCVCNGGGAFSLHDGQACPYYRNGLIGDKNSKWEIKLQNLYTGDSITAAQILELMWLTGGGWPWTQEEWDKSWKYPLIWSTVPVNTILRISEETVGPDGKTKKVEPYYEHRLAAQKTTIDLASGKVKQDAAKILTGGTEVFWKRDSADQTTEGDKEPSFPNIVQYMEFKVTTPLQIVWPRSLFSTEDLDLGTPEDYRIYLETYTSDLKHTYKKYHWTEDGMCTSVATSTNGGFYPAGLLCLNTAFLLGNWAERRDELLEAIKTPQEVIKTKNQKLLKEFYKDLMESFKTGGDPVIADAIYRSTPQNFGMTFFEKIKLNPLVEENAIIVLGFKYEGKVGATFVKVKSMFRHSYLFQTKGTLHTSWFPYWDGRPSYFLQGEEGSKWYEKAFDNTFEGDDPGSVSVLHDSGKIEFKTFCIDRDGIPQADVEPWKIYRPNATDYAKVTDHRNAAQEFDEELGDWHPLGVCGGYIVLRLNTEKFNAHNERMIFKLEGTEQPAEDDPEGEVRSLQFLPIMYKQVNRKYPGDTNDSKTKEKSGSFTKIKDPEDPLDLEEGPLHPWIIIARAVQVPEDEEIEEWYEYNNELYPKPEWYTDIFDFTRTTLKIKYAYIEDRVEKKAKDSKKDAKSMKEIQSESDLAFELENESDPKIGGFRHANYKCIFKYDPDGSGVGVDTEGSSGGSGGEEDPTAKEIDGKTTIVHGAKCQTALWPYARFTCRDIEICYVWKNNRYVFKDCEGQTTKDPGDAPVTNPWDDRWVAVMGDHNFRLGGRGSDIDIARNIIVKNDGPDGKYGEVWANVHVPYNLMRLWSKDEQQACLYDPNYCVWIQSKSSKTDEELVSAYQLEHQYGLRTTDAYWNYDAWRFCGPRYYPYTRYSIGTVVTSHDPSFCADFWQVYTNGGVDPGIERLIGFPAAYGYMGGEELVTEGEPDKFYGWVRPRGPSYDCEIWQTEPTFKWSANNYQGRLPLFGNMGRDAFFLDIVTLGQSPCGEFSEGYENLPWDAPQGKRSNPKPELKKLDELLFPIFSHYGNGELVFDNYRSANTFRPIECEISRTVKPLSGQSQNPFYMYMFADKPWNESADMQDYDETDEPGDGYCKIVPAAKLRWVNRQRGNHEIPAVKKDDKGKEEYRTRIDYARLYHKHFYFDDTKWYEEFYGMPYDPPFVINQHFHSMRSVDSDTKKQPMWAWPMGTTDKFTRNIKLIVETVNQDGEKEWTIYPDQGLSAISSLDLPPYVMANQLSETADDGRDISLGPVLDEDKIQNTADDKRQENYYKKTYHLIVTKSERIEGGRYKDAEIGVCKVDNEDVGDLKKEPVCWYTVDKDGVITEKAHSYKNNAKNLGLGAATIVSQTEQVEPWKFYPGFKISSVQSRYLGKNMEDKKYESDKLSETLLEKIPGSERSEFHMVKAVFKDARSISGDPLSVEVKYNFDSKALGVTSIIAMFKAISLRKDTAGEVWLATNETAMPFEDDEKTITYDLGFEFSTQLDMEFYFMINKTLKEFNDEPIWGEDEEQGTLDGVISTITLTYLYPGKAGEVVKVEPTDFLVSACTASTRGKESYNFFDFKKDWVIPKYDTIIYRLDSARCNNKPIPLAWHFFTYPELPIGTHRTVRSLNGGGIGGDLQACDLVDLAKEEEWLRGGMWATHLGGQEHFGVFPTKVYDKDKGLFRLKSSAVWWPAIPYEDGKLLMKGRAWIHSQQYKDEYDVTKSNREEAKDSKYTQNTDLVRKSKRFYEVERVTFDKVLEYEEYQKKVYEEAQAKAKENELGESVTLRAIVPRHDVYHIIHVIGGGDLVKKFPTLNNDLEPPGASSFTKIKKECKLTYKNWTWEDIDSFTFAKEGEKRATDFTRPKSWRWSCKVCDVDKDGKKQYNFITDPIIKDGFDFEGYERTVYHFRIDDFRCVEKSKCVNECNGGYTPDFWDVDKYWLYKDVHGQSPEKCSQYTDRITSQLTDLLKKDPDKPLKF